MTLKLDFKKQENMKRKMGNGYDSPEIAVELTELTELGMGVVSPTLFIFNPVSPCKFI